MSHFALIKKTIHQPLCLSSHQMGLASHHITHPPSDQDLHTHRTWDVRPSSGTCTRHMKSINSSLSLFAIRLPWAPGHTRWWFMTFVFWAPSWDSQTLAQRHRGQRHAKTCSPPIPLPSRSGHRHKMTQSWLWGSLRMLIILVKSPITPSSN